MHMGLNPESGGWACWRDSTHRGGSTARMVQLLKGCSWAEAVKIAGEDADPRPGDWAEIARQAATLADDPSAPVRPRPVDVPREFRSVEPGDRFARYLIRRRKFREGDIPALTRSYDLRGTMTGRYAWRLVLPFLHDRRGAWVGWQARSISPQAKIRYLAYPDSSTAKQFLFNRGPALAGGDLLVVVEGPLDCLKVDFYGQRAGIRSVGLLSTAATSPQLRQLYRLARRFRRVAVLLDPAAEASALDLCARLASFDPVLLSCPDHIEDPGDFTPHEIVPFFRACY